MNKINKKGMDAKELILWALAIMFLAIMAFLLITNTSSGSKKIKDILKSGDFDGDNSDPANMYPSDIADPCPCGSDNVKQILNSDSKKYCVISQSEDACNSMNVIAGKVYKEETKKDATSKFFFWNNGKCLYTVQGCNYYILYSENT